MSQPSRSAPPSSLASSRILVDNNDEGSSRQKQKTQKSARICPTTGNEIRIVDRFQDMSPDMKAQIWFSRKELDDTMLECRQTVVQMRDSVPLCDDGDFTSRGLEYCTPDGFDITTSSGDIIRLILEEQHRQREEGIFDPELLAAAGGGISRHRSRIAHLAAMKDARAVYGDNPQLTSASSLLTGNNSGSPTRSNSFSGLRESRRGRKSRCGSFGAMEEKVRRRRGSRGPLGERPDSTECVA